MKSELSLQTEARSMATVAVQAWQDYHNRQLTIPLAETVGGNPGANAATIVLASMPNTVFRGHYFSTQRGEEVSVERVYTRRVVARVDGEAPLYAMEEFQEERFNGGAAQGKDEPVLAIESESLIDVLREADDAVAMDELAEAVRPVLERVDFSFGDPTLSWAEVTRRGREEIEKAMPMDEFAPSERLRLRLEIGELVEGRLEPNDFLLQTIARRRRAYDEREAVTEVVNHVEQNRVA